MGWGNPVLGGVTLIRQAIQSLNFVTGVSGWRIKQDGTAEFNNVTIRGAVSVGSTDLQYSGAPAFGNLIESSSATTGTDSFGNAYLDGEVTYRNGASGNREALQKSGYSLVWFTAPTAAGPWTSGSNLFFQQTYVDLAADLLMNTFTIIGPSNDTSGATDGPKINSRLNNGFAVFLMPGTYYTNVPIEIPANGILRGSGRSTVDVFSTQTIIRATAAMAAVVCSKGWLENTNTATQSGIYLAGFKVDGNFLATHGIVLQNMDSLVENCQSGNVSTDAFRLDGVSQDGTTNLTGSGVNCRFVNCLAEDCGQGFHTNDPNGKFTDGFLVNCHAATISGVAAITVFAATGWLITGCHVYGLSQNGIQVGQTFMTRVIGNYVETWGGSAVLGTYRAIDAFFRANSDEGSGSVISGNTLDCHAAPGNAGSTLEGIGFRGANANTATVAITGNLMRCSPSSGFAVANAIGLYGGGATAIVIVTSTGNNPTGHWTNNVFQSAGGGTITLSAGV